MIMSTMESCINSWIRGITDPIILEKDPIRACQHAEYVEEYQWAIKHWFHSDVAVIEEIHEGKTPYVTVVLEQWELDAQGTPTFKTTRLDLSEKELVGIYRYYQAFTNQK